MNNREKQFAPFAALKGYEEELYVQEKRLTYEARREISEDEAERLNRKICSLQEGEQIAVTHYFGCRYIKTEGNLTQLNPEKGFLKLDGRLIRFCDIYRLE